MRYSAIAELSIFASCAALFIGYHVWLFLLRHSMPKHRQHYIDIYSMSHKSKGVWRS